MCTYLFFTAVPQEPKVYLWSLHHVIPMVSLQFPRCSSISCICSSILLFFQLCTTTRAKSVTWPIVLTWHFNLAFLFLRYEIEKGLRVILTGWLRREATILIQFTAQCAVFVIFIYTIITPPWSSSKSHISTATEGKRDNWLGRVHLYSSAPPFHPPQ